MLPDLPCSQEIVTPTAVEMLGCLRHVLRTREDVSPMLYSLACSSLSTPLPAWS